MAIAAQSSRISSRARPMRWMPKKSQDQAALSASWTRNAPSAQGAPAKPRRFQTSQAAIAMRPYSTDHTTPNTHLGGVSAGLVSWSYHAPAWNREPSAATPYHRPSQPQSPLQVRRRMPLRLREPGPGDGEGVSRLGFLRHRVAALPPTSARAEVHGFRNAGA